MSGDVQPRKRKDKRKKKEGTSLGNIHEPIPAHKFKGRSFDEDSEPSPVIGSVDPGEKIHVHNDHGIGGNICVKIIFFCLLAALVAAVGIIFIHSRGSTDVDLPSVEDSRFADYFTGWLDDATDDHAQNEHELAHGDEDGHDPEDDEHGGEEDELSPEETNEKSEEEDREGDNAAEEGSPEAVENDEEADEEEDDDERPMEDNEDESEPKFKVVHRFKHFFDKRKKYHVSVKNEESTAKKRRRMTEMDDDEESKMEYEEDEEELEENDDEEENRFIRKSRREDNKRDRELIMKKKGREEVDAEIDDEEEGEDDDEDTEDDKEDEVDEGDKKNALREKILEIEKMVRERIMNKKKKEEVKLDEEEEEEDDDDDDDDDDEDEVVDEDEDGQNEIEAMDKRDEESEEMREGDIKDEEDEESNEEVKETDEEDEENEEDRKQSRENDEDISKEREEDDDEADNGSSDQVEGEADQDSEREDEEDEETETEKSSKADLGLDEIDESEEALKEEEMLIQAEEPSKQDEDLEGTDYFIKRDDVKDEEVEKVESKIIDIEEKLNQILREKRKKVEQRKMELEEIEIGSITDETGGDEEGKDVEGDEDDEETESHGVAVKVIVGIALIVVAHLVLIKKWNSMNSLPSDEKAQADEAEEETKEVTDDGVVEPVISRRQTLVPEATDLNEYFADEVEEDTEEEVEEDEEDGEEELEEEEEEEISEEYSEEDVVKDDRKWTVDYPSRISNLTREEEEYTEEEEELEDEEVEEEEEEEELEDEEDIEEDDYEWKRLETAKGEVKEEEEEEAEKEEEPVEERPIPPPRRRHMSSGERRGGPQAMDDFAQINEAFEELWDGYDSIDQGEPASYGEKDQEELEEAVDENPEEDIYKEEFRFAQDQLDNNPTAALKKYELILSRLPESVKALIGRAKALDKIAEKERSNQYLREAINAYRILLTKHEDLLADGEFLNLSERCIDRMRFRGYFKSAIEIHKGLIKKFPGNPKFRNDLSVTYLFLNDIKSAKELLSETLKIWPKDGFALVHYGFVLKTSDNNHAEAVDYLTEGIRSREPGVIDGRFFFHLGDALNRLGRGKEAIEWYDEGVKEGLFRSRYQRSLYNVDRLKSKPWWTHSETTYQDFFKKLEDNWEKIRNEGLNLLNSKGVNLFKDESENLKDTGDWRQLDLYFRGTRHPNCNQAPFTCSLIGSFPSASTCTRGQVKFSVMLPSTHVWPHCGPTNCRLRSHLGLVVPTKTFIRVAEETRSWEEGKVMIFDDSFEHEVWHNGTGPRLVLIVDVWHPELTQKERNFLSPI